MNRMEVKQSDNKAAIEHQEQEHLLLLQKMGELLLLQRGVEEGDSYQRAGELLDTCREKKSQLNRFKEILPEKSRLEEALQQKKKELAELKTGLEADYYPLGEAAALWYRSHQSDLLASFGEAITELEDSIASAEQDLQRETQREKTSFFDKLSASTQALFGKASLSSRKSSLKKKYQELGKKLVDEETFLESHDDPGIQSAGKEFFAVLPRIREIRMEMEEMNGHLSALLEELDVLGGGKKPLRQIEIRESELAPMEEELGKVYQGIASEYEKRDEEELSEDLKEALTQREHNEERMAGLQEEKRKIDAWFKAEEEARELERQQESQKLIEQEIKDKQRELRELKKAIKETEKLRTMHLEEAGEVFEDEPPSEEAEESEVFETEGESKDEGADSDVQ